MSTGPGYLDPSVCRARAAWRRILKFRQLARASARALVAGPNHGSRRPSSCLEAASRAHLDRARAEHGITRKRVYSRGLEPPKRGDEKKEEQEGKWVHTWSEARGPAHRPHRQRRPTHEPARCPARRLRGLRGLRGRDQGRTFGAPGDWQPLRCASGRRQAGRRGL